MFCKLCSGLGASLDSPFGVSISLLVFFSLSFFSLPRVHKCAYIHFNPTTKISVHTYKKSCVVINHKAVA